MESRQRALWELDKLKRRPPAKSNAPRRPAYHDVAQDFEQLQLRNYNLSGAAIQNDALDYARIREEAAEVKKRASRLKGYLSLPEAADRDRKQNKSAEEIATPAQVKAAVASLDALVNSFVWNPVFQHTGVVDVEQSAKAGRDLDAIINLSERIRRGAETLGKSNGKKL